MPIKKDFIYVGIILLLIFLAVFYLQKNQQKLKSQEVPVYAWEITEVAGNLEVPWDMALLPNKDIFITERPGRLKLLTKDGQVKIVATLPQVASVGESGLTGLSNELVIVDQLPGGNIHNGGRLRFGPDNKLWVLTGDGGQADLAQSMNSLGGKVLRIDDDGSSPEIYSLGHRNPQGLDFHPLTGQPLVTEHGQTAYDEINLIKQGGNYGWPIVKKCYSDDPEFTPPILCSEEQTWAPSGAAFLGNSLFFAGLRGQMLERVEIIDGQVASRETIIKDTYGRLRGVLADPKEGALYVSTSNRDGRGNPKQGDDKILKIQSKLID